MDLPSPLSNALDWLRRLGSNLYFWSGVGVLVLVAGIVYVTFDFFVMPAYTRHDVSIQVPNVEEVPVTEARQTLEAKGLQVEEQPGRYNPNVPRGLVVDQSPPPSSGVKPGRRVYLTVNRGEVPTVQIPDLTGSSLREARNRITSIGLKVGDVREDSVPSPYPQTVTRQRPQPGDSLDEGKTVDLWYSTGLGNTTVRVPALVGMRVDRAQQRLLQQKLRSVVVTAQAGDDSEDTSQSGRSQQGDAQLSKRQLFVREQSRSPGASVRTGTEIRLFTTTDSTQASEQRRQIPDSLLDPSARPSPVDTAAADTAAADTSSSRIGF